jgi:tetratricopeptide (TPR) repeat protein
VSRRGALLLTAALCLPSAAHAEPTLWQRVPEARSAQRLKARLYAEQLFDQVTDPRVDPDVQHDLSADGAALLQLEGARRDAMTRVLLGRLLLEARTGHEAQATSMIESGVYALPDSDFKRSSLFDAGLGAILSGDFAHADRAFSAALALAWDPGDRATLHRLRAKARMLSGRLLDSMRDFRAAVRLARDTEGLALSHFALGVALERSGDYPEGMREIARGVAIKLPVPPYPGPSVLDAPGLRWFPDYDVHYYRALGAMSEAAQADSRELEQERYEAALESWEQYLPAAEAAKDPFFSNAERERKRCTDALLRLKKAQGAASSGGVR